MLGLLLKRELGFKSKQLLLPGHSVAGGNNSPNPSSQLNHLIGHVNVSNLLKNILRRKMLFPRNASANCRGVARGAAKVGFLCQLAKYFAYDWHTNKNIWIKRTKERGTLIATRRTTWSRFLVSLLVVVANLEKESNLGPTWKSWQTGHLSWFSSFHVTLSLV